MPGVYDYLLFVRWRDCYCEDHEDCVPLPCDHPEVVDGCLQFFRLKKDFLNFTGVELFVKDTDLEHDR